MNSAEPVPKAIQGILPPSLSVCITVCDVLDAIFDILDNMLE